VTYSEHKIAYCFQFIVVYLQFCSSCYFINRSCSHLGSRLHNVVFILIINQTDALISEIYFWNKTLYVSDSSSVHHQEFFTVRTATVYFIQLASSPVWHISLLCVQWKTPDDEQRNCPKHVEFYSKNKCEKLVHLVGFIIRIYVLLNGLLYIPYQCSAANLQ